MSSFAVPRGRRLWLARALLSSLALLALIVLFGAGAMLRAQDGKPPQEPPPKQEPPKQEPPKQDAPPAAPPKIQFPNQPPGGRPSGASLPVESIEKLRNGRTTAIARSATAFDLDLGAVDWKNDPLVLVDGAPITRAQVDRQVCLLLGANEIDQFITAVLLRNVKKELKEKGQPLATLSITEADVQKKFDEDKKVMPQMAGMTAEQYEKQIKEVFGWDHYVEFQKLQMEFERVLLPDPTPEFVATQSAKWKPLEEAHKKALADKLKELQKPGQPPPKPSDPEVAKQLPAPQIPEADLSWIPATTWQLMDPRFVKSIQDLYACGHEMHPLIRQSVVGTMRTNLLKQIEVKLAPPDDHDHFMFVGGEPVMLKDILALLSPRVDDSVRRMALRELLNFAAVDKRLAAENASETPEQSDLALKEVEKQYENSFIPLAQAVRLYGFNSLWHYRPFFARKHAYKQHFLKSVSEENVRAHYDEDGRIFFEGGTVVTEVLFVPGTDRASAKPGMDALIAEIAAGKTFAALARDPAKNRFPDSKDVKQGTIIPSVRTKLRMALGESEYIAWLTGYSLADEAFYVAKEDSVVGPVWRDYSPSLTGWVALHVERYFTTGSRREFEKAKDSAQEDLVDLTFPRWANEALARVSIEIPKRG